MSVWQILELACRASGMTEQEAKQALDDGVVEQLLMNRYGVSVDDYITIVKEIVPFTSRIRSTFSDDAYHVFADPETGAPIFKAKAS